MRSENSPLVKNFTHLVLKTIYLQKRYNLTQKKLVINADLIPHISEDIMRPKLLSERTINPFESNPHEDETKSELKKLAEKIELKKNKHQKSSLAKQSIHIQSPEVESIFKPSLTTPKSKQPIKTNSYQLPNPGKKRFTIPADQSPQPVVPVGSKFGKIELLLHDPTVTLIECYGADKYLSIIRTGQRQPTKIKLIQQEIDNLIKKMADEARIPLIEGVFRAAVENFVVHSVISNNVGVRFIIKKYTPYSMLDPRQKQGH